MINSFHFRMSFFAISLMVLFFYGNKAAFPEENLSKKYIDVHIHLCADESPVKLTEKGKVILKESKKQGKKQPGKIIIPSANTNKKTSDSSAMYSELKKNTKQVSVKLPSKDKHKSSKSKKKREPFFDKPAANLISLMDSSGIEKAIIMPAPLPGRNRIPNQAEDFVNAVKRHSTRLIYAGGGDTLNPEIFLTSPEEVNDKIISEFVNTAQQVLKSGAVAFGEIAILQFSFHKEQPFLQIKPDHPLLLLLSDIAARNNIPIDIHMEAVPYTMPMPFGLDRLSEANPSTINENIDGFEKLLLHNRNTRIVWQHIGCDNTGKMTIGLLRRLLELHSNLYLAIKVDEKQLAFDGSPLPNRIVNDNSQIKPEWLKLFQEFPERFVTGSDSFISAPTKQTEANKAFRLTWNVVEQLPGDLAEKIGRDNALKIYNIH